mgnify:FL=1
MYKRQILDGTGLTVKGSEHKFTSGTSGDLSLILESDTDNNNEADNPKILFRQDGTQDLNSIGLNFSGHIARDNNSLYLASSGSQSGIVFLTGTSDGYTNATEKLRITPTGEVGIGTSVPTSKLHVLGNALITGIATFGSSSTTINGNTDTINVGTALTLGHSQGLQFHTQNLHSTGFEVNNINATGIITATNFTKTDGTPIASTDIAINTLSSSSATGGGLSLIHI